MNDYKLKPVKYFSNARHDLIRFIPKRNNQSILEVGAGTCETLVTLKKKQYANFVVGVDLVAIANSNQSNPIVDDFIVGNIESIELNYVEFFDVILLGDVLEHLVDPWVTVKKLSNYLKKGGIIISSIPNFLYYKNLKTVIFDADFKYQDDGILDRTHLRFFCKKNIIEIFESNQFDITLLSSNFDLEKGKKYQLCRVFAFMHKYFVTQYHCVATLKGPLNND
ncbi:hypothetical protein MNBD_GAMMA03-245 [hydrothermal vent metagenome]|uniref:Uncharacterized protein n=1 Tax=hydrothermal vent metagenome TaxID=652676 RepID=A0A3B0W0I1_9ZZZZ